MTQAPIVPDGPIESHVIMVLRLQRVGDTRSIPEILVNTPGYAPCSYAPQSNPKSDPFMVLEPFGPLTMAELPFPTTQVGHNFHDIGA